MTVSGTVRGARASMFLRYAPFFRRKFFEKSRLSRTIPIVRRWRYISDRLEAIILSIYLNTGTKIHLLIVIGAFKMKPHTASIDIANTIAVQKLIREYLVPPFERFVESDVSIKAQQTWNRSGVPSDGA